MGEGKTKGIINLEKPICQHECRKGTNIGDACMEEHEESGWLCCRIKGHDGHHAACSSNECSVYVWGGSDDDNGIEYGDGPWAEGWEERSCDGPGISKKEKENGQE